ncbi:hypothetical protein F0U60_04815 [Archangium minus]|uniref:Uncharacterized protein n=1 Tax=Archangium minus TaxID=83450 RepID=A0ABY9WIF3_9BACT|nr:hypothetical protein F0U61_04800 [Archangium violaceum]WNG43493.1 hypothetical protein F0U60_04815 [Archangium minus]
MKYNKNFDVDAVLRTVEAVSKNHPEGSPEDEALRICAAALLFVRDDVRKLEEFREFFRKITTPATEGIKIAHTFATREEAENWLASGAATDGQLVRAGGQGFTVVDRGPKGLKLVRIPLPDELSTHKPEK